MSLIFVKKGQNEFDCQSCERKLIAVDVSAHAWHWHGEKTYVVVNTREDD